MKFTQQWGDPSTSPSAWRRGMLILGLVASGLLATIHLQSHSQSASSTSYGSTAQMQAQVVGPANSTMLWQTYGVNAGDEIKWTSYVQPKTPNPAEIIGTHVLPAGHTWMKGHSQTLLSPNTTIIGWMVGGVWQTAEPDTGTLVSQVKWLMLPGQTVAASKPVTVPGAADWIHTSLSGSWSFSYKDRLYSLGYVGQSLVPGVGENGLDLILGLSCHNTATNAACPGFPEKSYSADYPLDTTMSYERYPPTASPGVGVMYGVGLEGTRGTVLNMNNRSFQWRSTWIDQGYFDSESGKLYVATTSTYRYESQRKNYIVCTDLNGDYAISCGTFLVGPVALGQPFYFAEIMGLGSYNRKFYFLTSDKKISCFDASTETMCSQSTTYATKEFNPVYTPSVVGGGKILFTDAKTYANQSDTNKPENSIFCHDMVTNTYCAGWTNAGVFAGSAQLAFPYLNTDGSPRGSCTGGVIDYVASTGVSLAPCIGYDGNFFQASDSYKRYIQKYFDGTYISPSQLGKNMAGIVGTKVYMGGTFTNATSYSYYYYEQLGGTNTAVFTPLSVGCFDFATDSECTPINNLRMGKTNNIRVDPQYPGCLMITGESIYYPDYYPWPASNYYTLNGGTKGGVYVVDPTTGRPCSGGGSADSGNTTLRVLDVNPADYYKCDPTRANVRGWLALRMTPNALPWNASGGVSAIEVTLQDSSGVKLNVANNPRNFAAGSHALDISDIPYATYPRLKFSIKVTPVGKINITDPRRFGVDVTWDGDMIQQCFVTKAPNTLDCESRSSADITLTRMQERGRTDDLFATGLRVDETLAIGKVLSPNISYSGFAAVSASTTPRAILTDLASGEAATRVVQGRFTLGPSNFSGDAWVFGLDASTGQINPASKALVSGVLGDPASRPMYTAAPYSSTWVPMKSLTIGNITAAQQLAALNTSLAGRTDNKAEARINYLRGVAGDWRARADNPLGPVINSGVSVLYPWAIAGMSEANHPGYTAYRTDTAKTRSAPLALWGGNDGALHALKVNGSTLSEAWSFVPDVMLRQIKRYTDGNLEQLNLNPYFVDNIPMVGHANLASDTSQAKSADWRAVAAITYGQGARAITAIDVTKENLGALDSRGVLFEYTHTTPGDLDGDGQPDLQDLGHIVSQPIASETLGSQQIVKMNDGRWAVLVGNGTNSAHSLAPARASAVLYVFYLDAPRAGYPRWRRIAVDNAVSSAQDKLALQNNNGLSTPRPLDVDGDGKVDLAYAGDLQGNLWRFDLSSAALAFTTSSGPTNNTTAQVNTFVSKLFQTSPGQAIQGAPLVVRNGLPEGCATAINLGAETPNRGCWQVLFGTGAYLTPLEGRNAAAQTEHMLVGLVDTNVANAAPVTKSELVERSFDNISQAGDASILFRAMVAGSVDYAGGKKGWWTALGTAENLVAAPRLLPSGQAMFTVVQPLDAGVSTGCRLARSWLYLLNPLSGEASSPTFDTNGDGVVDSNDAIDGRTASAMALSGGSYVAPTVLLDATASSTGMSLLPSSLGQDSSVSRSWSAGRADDGSSQSKAIRSGLHKNNGRLTWREVY